MITYNSPKIFIDDNSGDYDYLVELLEVDGLFHVMCFRCIDSLGIGIEPTEAVLNSLESAQAQAVLFVGGDEVHLMCMDCVSKLSNSNSV